jgi:hypothetical protein
LHAACQSPVGMLDWTGSRSGIHAGLTRREIGRVHRILPEQRGSHFRAAVGINERGKPNTVPYRLARFC